MRDLEMAAYQGNYRADLALDLVDKSIIKYIGAYAAEMNGVDAIVFTAGIGENGLDSCAIVCRSLSYLGLDFCEKANADRVHITEVSKPGSKVKAYVIPTNEELTIARDAKELIESKLK
jgi:acetate kinase